MPTFLGGDTSYHFVLTDSMEGSLNPGTFVILHRSDTYEVGQAVGYWLDLGNDNRATILHRIVGRLPNGNYVLKGDAVETTEEVEEEAITGRLVFAVPGLGFLQGAFSQAPLLLGGILVALFFLSGGIMKKADRRTKEGWTAEGQSIEKTKERPRKETCSFQLHWWSWFLFPSPRQLWVACCRPSPIWAPPISSWERCPCS